MSNNDKLYKFAIDNGLDPARIPANDASNWVLKALHPANEVTGPITGVPDLDTQNTLTFEWRQTDTITAPPGMSAGDTWDLEVTSLPGPGIFAIYRRAKSAVTPSWAQFIIMNKQYNWGSTKPTFASDGTISGGNPGNWGTDVKLFRGMYHSMTAVTNAASLTDQGMMVSGQIPSVYRMDNYGNVIGNNSGTAPVTVRGSSQPGPWSYAASNGDVPSFDTLLATCPRGEMRRARDGVYIPTRFTDGQFLWQTATPTLADGVGPWGGSSNILSADPAFTPVPFFTRMNMGITCYRGLASSTSITLFTRCGVEAACEATSNFKPFITPSCAPDMRSIEEYFKLSSMLSESYESSYNDKDILSAIIAELASSLSAPWNKIVPLAFKGLKAAAGKGISNKKGKQSESAKVAIEQQLGQSSLEDTASPNTKKKAGKSKGPIPRPKPVQKTVSRVRK